MINDIANWEQRTLDEQERGLLTLPYAKELRSDLLAPCLPQPSIIVNFLSRDIQW